jgi:heme-binding protein
MRKWLKRTLIIIGVLIVAAQVVRPSRTNPGSDPKDHIQAMAPAGPEVNAALARSCNDCHSNNTTWPWYSNVAPVSWLVASDVKEGRSEMNFSAWRTYKGEKQQELLGKICKQINEGEMPMATYTWAHPSAKLSDADRLALCSWTKTAALNLPAEHETEEKEAD